MYTPLPVEKGTTCSVLKLHSFKAELTVVNVKLSL
jgi:hypothetical protein